MPAPERTTVPQIAAAARALLETGGLPAITMQAVAERVGVRAPSLYKRVRDRDAMLALVVADCVAELAAALDAAVASAADARGRLLELGGALRGFARAHPAAYGLLFAMAHPSLRPSPDELDRLVAPVLSATEELAGPEHALDAARLVTAWANGFITMELAGAFQLGGDVDAAWDWGLRRIVAAI